MEHSEVEMETQLQSCYFTKKGPALVSLFGYATKSVPGLEINGLGKYGRTVREKVVFVTRTRGLPIPLKRFVLNVELTDDLGDLEGAAVRWLEYPLLLHYWFLAGLLPITTLDNCLALGALNPGGLVEEPYGPAIADLCAANGLHLISSTSPAPGPARVIDARDLFGAVARLEFRPRGLPAESKSF
jgi:hypothetical protein